MALMFCCILKGFVGTCALIDKCSSGLAAESRKAVDAELQQLLGRVA
jgi:hypothetical protein